MRCGVSVPVGNMAHGLVSCTNARNALSVSIRTQLVPGGYLDGLDAAALPLALHTFAQVPVREESIPDEPIRPTARVDPLISTGRI